MIPEGASLKGRELDTRLAFYLIGTQSLEVNASQNTQFLLSSVVSKIIHSLLHDRDSSNMYMLFTLLTHQIKLNLTEENKFRLIHCITEIAKDFPSKNTGVIIENKYTPYFINELMKSQFLQKLGRKSQFSLLLSLRYFNLETETVFRLLKMISNGDPHLLHRNLMKHIKSLIKDPKFVVDNSAILQEYVKSKDFLRENMLEVRTLAASLYLVSNSRHEVLQTFKIFKMKEIELALQNETVALKFLKFLKVADWKEFKLHEINPLILKAIQVCRTAGNEEVNEVVITIFEKISVFYKELESKLLLQLKSASLKSCFNFFETQYLPIATHFPERTRKILPLFFRGLLNLDLRASLETQQYLDIIDKSQVYSKMSDGPFLTKTPSWSEQIKIDEERYALETFLLSARLKTIDYEDGQYRYNDVFKKVFEIIKFISFDDALHVQTLLSFHKMFSDVLINKALMIPPTIDQIEFTEYLKKFDKLFYRVLAEAKRAKSLNKLDKTAKLFRFLELLTVVMGSMSKKCAILPTLFRELDDCVMKNRYPNTSLESRFDFLSTNQELAKNTLINIFQHHKLIERDNDLDLLCQLPITGISLMMEPIHYQTALSQNSRRLASEYSIYTLSLFLKFYGEIVSITEDPLFDSKHVKVKETTMAYVEFYSKDAYKGDVSEHKNFIKKCQEIRTQFNVKTASSEKKQASESAKETPKVDPKPTPMPAPKSEAKGKKKKKKR